MFKHRKLKKYLKHQGVDVKDMSFEKFFELTGVKIEKELTQETIKLFKHSGFHVALSEDKSYLIYSSKKVRRNF